MTTTATIRPTSIKYNGTGRADYSKVSDDNDSTYVEWGSGDNNKRDEYYLGDLPGAAYSVTKVEFTSRLKTTGNSDETDTIFDKDNNTIKEVTISCNNTTKNNSGSSSTIRTVAAINGAWTRCQPYGIDWLKKSRQLDTWAVVTYWTVTEAKQHFQL